jgi:hypothetical protein
MRGLNVPFYKNMTFKKSKLFDRRLVEKPSFLIDLSLLMLSKLL